MYCPNCGNDMKEDKFCTKCGYSKGSRNDVTPPAPVTNPKKSSKGGVAAIIAVIALFGLMFFGSIITIIVFVFKSTFGLASKEFVELDMFSIPTIYKVTGEKFNICSFHYESSDISVKLCNPISDEKVKEYVDYLINHEDYILYEGSYDYNLYKEDNGYVIYVIIDNNSVFKYTYSAGKFGKENDSLGV